MSIIERPVESATDDAAAIAELHESLGTQHRAFRRDPYPTAEERLSASRRWPAWSSRTATPSARR